MLNRLGLSFVLDTHLIDDPAAAMENLRQMHNAGWLDLTRTDVMDTELSTANADHRAVLLSLSGNLIEHLGPAVPDHSRLGSAVIGSQIDSDRVDSVFSTLFPGADRATARRQHVCDAMNVATAIRYGATGLLTRERRLLNKSATIRQRFNGFFLNTPERALEVALRLKHRYEVRGGPQADET